MPVVINNKESAKKAIIAVGQSLINRAEDIANDIEKVTSIHIEALLDPFEVVNFDVTKNYVATLEEEKEEKEK